MLPQRLHDPYVNLEGQVSGQCSTCKEDSSRTPTQLEKQSLSPPRNLKSKKRAVRSKRARWLRRSFITLAILGTLGTIAAITYISLVAALIKQLTPPRVQNGLQSIVDNWKEPDSNGAYKFTWRDGFSRDITPVNCHSHNDYWRHVPLYQALAAGCTSVEADIWLTDSSELLVSHNLKSTTAARTLQSLYLDPLTNILTNLNVSTTDSKTRDQGIFDRDPSVSLKLLIDIKTDGPKTYAALEKQLQPLMDKGWLTYFNGTAINPGPLTIVGTGNTPFDLIQKKSSSRFIFYDAPLSDISNDMYNTTNSLYASVEMKKAVGRIWFDVLRKDQIDTVKKQIGEAAAKGLLSRYWDTPAWPISLRDRVWTVLTENEVGMLNVDDVISATRWNWNWCVVAGLGLCGKV